MWYNLNSFSSENYISQEGNSLREEWSENGLFQKKKCTPMLRISISFKLTSLDFEFILPWPPPLEFTQIPTFFLLITLGKSHFLHFWHTLWKIPLLLLYLLDIFFGNCILMRKIFFLFLINFQVPVKEMLSCDRKIFYWCKSFDML